MQALRVPLGVLVAIIVVISLPLAIWTYAGIEVALNPDTYKNGLANQNVYPDIVPVALPALAREINQQAEASGEDIPLTFSQIIRELRAEDWQAIANDLVPPDWLRAQIDAGIDAIFLWLNTDSDEITGSIDVTELRQRLSGNEGQRAINRIIDASPQCSNAQVSTLIAISEGQSSLAPPICKPPGQYIAVISSLLSDTLASTAQRLESNQVSLIELLAGNTPDTREQFMNGAQIVRLGVQTIQQIILLFFLCPAALLSLLVIFAIRSMQNFGRWIGGTSLISGLVTLIPLPFTPLRLLLSDSILTTNIQNIENAQVSEFFSRLTLGFQQSIIDGFNTPVLMFAGILIGIGFILLGIAAVIPSPEEQEEIIAERLAMSAGSTAAPRAITINVPMDDI